MNSDSIKYVLQDFMERPLPASRSRQLVLPTASGKVIGLAGVRRCGKTFLFFDTMRRLLAQGVDRRRIVYMNFEDDRLQPVQVAELDLVMRGLHELFPETAQGPVYLFLDEVQNAPGWERWVRRLCDTHEVSVFVTGSSSRLLTRDLGTALRGRSVTFEVFPLSFREYLDFRGIEPAPHSARSESRVRAEFVEYLHWGGFPEVVLADLAMRPLILEEYASVMLYRDLIERHAIRNEPLLRALLRHCFRHTASLLSVSKLHRDFRSAGFSVAKDTLFQYLALLEDGGLVFLLPKHSDSLRVQENNPKKLHVVDPGLIGAFQAGADRDLGHKLETAVFLECRRRSKEWHYHSNGGEVDLCDADGTEYLNVCWRLADADTVQREEAAMALGAERFPHARGHLLYHEYAPSAIARIPAAQPAWKWLLEERSPK
jgi:predicted AAA+ superfamily ATPase